MLYYHSWSGGKDSTASIILDHIHGLPPSSIIFSEVMFDKKRGISGELPEHIDFIYNKAVPRFKEWGYNVNILRSDRDYLDLFYHVVKNTNNVERIGKYSGFVLGGMCCVNDRLKIAPIRSFFSSVQDDYIQYVGIAIDEPKRLERLKNTNKLSLLAQYDYTEQMAYDLCKAYDLLSPVYNFTNRGGCWFCPNQRISEFAHLKQHYNNLWNELDKLSKSDNLLSDNFKYSLTFDDVDKKVDKYIETAYLQSLQLSFFD